MFATIALLKQIIMVFEDARIYTSKEVAKALHLTLQTIRKKAREREITAVKIGRGYRFLGSALNEFMNLKMNTYNG